jgi:hypothetical protein
MRVRTIVTGIRYETMRCDTWELRVYIYAETFTLLIRRRHISHVRVLSLSLSHRTLS